MRVVAWNCNMALHRKWSALMGLDADVTVICEAAHPQILQKRGCDLSELSYVWAGRVNENRNKGLLVLAKPSYELEIAEHWDPKLEIFLPVEVSGAERFNLLATWSFNRRSVGGMNPKPKALSRYKTWLSEGLMIGDFNSHVRWDRPNREWTFRRFVDALKSVGFESLYHQQSGLELGEEEDTTLYWRSRAAS